MEDKLIRIDEPLHRRIKAAAALQGRTIRDFTEQALRYYLDSKTLVDSGVQYQTKEAK